MHDGRAQKVNFNIFALLGKFLGGLPFFWLGIFFFCPFVLLVKMSLSESIFALPPYRPEFSNLQGWDDLWQRLGLLSFQSFVRMFEDGFYLEAFFSSFKIVFLSTFLTLLVSYPVAYAVSRCQGGWGHVLAGVMMLPFAMSFLMRIYAWMEILGRDGLINQILLKLGLIASPLSLLYSDFGFYFGIVYTYFPFMFLPLYVVLSRMDVALLEAAHDLGARSYQVFFWVILPLSWRGIVAGCLLVGIPVLGDMMTPSLLGGHDTLMLGKVIWDEFFRNRDWPMASSLALIMVFLLCFPLYISGRGLWRDVLEGQEKKE